MKHFRNLQSGREYFAFSYLFESEENKIDFDGGNLVLSNPIKLELQCLYPREISLDADFGTSTPDLGTTIDIRIRVENFQKHFS